MTDRVRIIAVLITSLILSIPISAVPVPAAETISWMTYDKAKQTRSDRKFFVYFYADWCGYCSSLEKTTFKDSAVAAYINRHFIPVRINIDKEKPIAAHFEVGGVPDLRFITAQGDAIAKWPGFIKAEQLLPLLKYIFTDSYLKQDFSEFIKNNP